MFAFVFQIPIILELCFSLSTVMKLCFTRQLLRLVFRFVVCNRRRGGAQSTARKMARTASCSRQDRIYSELQLLMNSKTSGVVLLCLIVPWTISATRNCAFLALVSAEDQAVSRRASNHCRIRGGIQALAHS